MELFGTKAKYALQQQIHFEANRYLALLRRYFDSNRYLVQSGVFYSVPQRCVYKLDLFRVDGIVQLLHYKFGPIRVRSSGVIPIESVKSVFPHRSCLKSWISLMK